MKMTKNSLFLVLAFSGVWLGFWNVVGPVQSGYPYILNPDQALVLFILSFPLLIAFIIADLFKNKTWQWVFLISIISCLVAIPTILSIGDRHASGKSSAYVHDNPIQIEEAVKFLLTWQNPYGQNYANTAMKNYGYGPWFYDLKGSAPPASYFVNPALFHLVSLPFGFISIVPFWLIWYSSFGWFDARIVYLLAFIGSIILGNLLVDKNNRLNFTTLFALNPFLSPFIIEGRNDILTVFLLLAFLVLAQKKKLISSAIILGLAIASKQSAWVFAAVYYLYKLIEVGLGNIKKLVKPVVITLITALVLILPFFLWDKNAFINDTFKYISGGTAYIYPIKGYGFSMLLLVLGKISNSLASYPAFLFQLIFSVPLVCFIFYLLKKQTDLKTMLFSFSLLLLVYLFFARFFLDNYFGVVIAFFILSYFVQGKDSLYEKED
jgi:hypothetical protein